MNKKAQIGETVTWFVATVIIVLLILISVFLATLGPWNDKKVGSEKSVDYLSSKSLNSYVLTESDNRERIYDQLVAEENLNDFNGQLALDIFEDYYGHEFGDVWIGMHLKNSFPSPPYPDNDYFGFRPYDSRGDVSFDSSPTFLFDEIYLLENKSVESILVLD